MTIIKCKMCGGDLELLEDSSVCECSYCGTKQTVPRADDEKKLKLFERANRLRTACEFDKAANVYETILADFDQEAEAYWGQILCKFGIEYVDDPATGRKIPTCHRSSFESLMDDPNFEMVMECADPIARRVYREEAKAIEELRRRIIEVSSKEEPYDVFICYKELAEDGQRTLDSVIAQDLYTELTDRGYLVFFSRISLESKLGLEYEPYIFAALNSAKVMLVVGTDYDYFNAVWVKNEWSRFLALIAKGEKKTLIPVFKNVDAYDMPKEFNKLTAQDMGKLGAMQDLIRGVEKILGRNKSENAQAQPVIQQIVQNGANLEALLKRGFMSLEDGQFDKATELFDRVLNDDPENADAYLGLTMAEAECKDRDSLRVQYIKPNSALRGDRSLSRARQFSPELKSWLEGLDEEGKKADEAYSQLEPERKKAEEQREYYTIEDGVLKGVQTVHRFSLKNAFLPPGVTGIGYGAFIHCYALTSVTIPESVTSIGDSAFLNCKTLTSVSIPESVTSIGKQAFAGCEALTDASIPKSVTTIGESAFSECKALRSVSIPEGVTGIGKHTFMGCEALTDVSIPESVTSIGDSAFFKCKALRSVSIPEGVTSIGKQVFCGCEALTSVTIPESVTNIDGYVFMDCKALTSVTIPESVTSIGYSAFYSCYSLKSVTIPKSVTSIGADVFPKSVKICAYEGTYAEEYAKREGFRFQRLKTKEEIAAEEAAAEKAEAERKAKINALNQEKASLQTELADLKGLFSGKRRKEIEARLAQIEAELR